MLRIISKNVMGRLYVTVLCSAHGYDFPHTVWSKSSQVGIEDAAGELHALSDAALLCLRDWEAGEFDFTDECFSPHSNNPWNRPAG
jgi:hypothetical protein